jgi:tRNA(Ile)-lysidine synthase TilS/MesJ
MQELVFRDRGGATERLPARPGEPVGAALLRARIPPPSVVVTADGTPVSADHRIADDRSYSAQLLEGYDLDGIRSAFDPVSDDAAYVDRRLTFDEAGALRSSATERTLADHEAAVEARLLDTIRHFDLVSAGETLVVGASGGLDSSALLRGLAAIRDDLPPVDLTAVTVTDFVPVEDARPPADIAETVESLGFDHRFVDADAVARAYGLDDSPTEAVRALADSDGVANLGSLAANINQRLLERVATDLGADAVLLGAHTTELLGGILNEWFTGATVRRQSIPAHSLGDLSHRYPLVFLSKRELYLYRYSKTGDTLRERTANPWDWLADERSFYYYLADMLQTLWPGIEYWAVESHNERVAATESLRFGDCANCGKTKATQDFDAAGHCAVCSALGSAGLLADDREGTP